MNNKGFRGIEEWRYGCMEENNTRGVEVWKDRGMAKNVKSLAPFNRLDCFGNINPSPQPSHRCFALETGSHDSFLVGSLCSARGEGALIRNDGQPKSLNVKNLTSSKKAAFTLAETFLEHFAGCGKVAFTLAEVLITLGIIGVVAAMTLPALIQKHQVKQYETQLKKSYTTITNGFKKMMADEGCSDIECLGLFVDYDTDEGFSRAMDHAARKVFNVVKSCTYEHNDEDCLGYDVKALKGSYIYENEFLVNNEVKYIMFLADGSVVRIPNDKCTPTNYPDKSKLKIACSWISVDINGRKKGPNTMGKDVFAFGSLSNLVEFYPDTSLEWVNATSREDDYWRNKVSQCGEPREKVSKYSGTVYGQNCFARILENDWKIDYL